MRFLPHLIFLGTLVSSALAWDEAGHEIVATIAQIHLHPSALPTICSILNDTSPGPGKPLCHLASVATWADSVRLEKRWSAPLHFVGAVDDHPSKTCLFPGKQGWEQNRNILNGMRNVTNLLGDFVKKQRGGIIVREDMELANEALKFLIHFLGDLHQPLHLTGRNRGGNDVKVLFNGNQTNLHKVWDKFLVEKAIRTTPHKYNYPLADKRVEYSLRGTYYDRYIRQIVAEGILDSWKHEIPDWLSCPRPKFSKDAPLAQMTERQSILSWAQWLVPDNDPTKGTDDAVLCPYTWAKKIHPLNCELAWPKELDQEPQQPQSVEIETGRIPFSGSEELELDTPKYAGVIAERKLVEMMLAQGGVRLANALNSLFAEDVV
ncbi:Phospholipase C/P1 nuclease domain containing protein [Amanita muscaria]